MMRNEPKLELATTIPFNDTICNCKIIGSALDHMSNDKQGRNNLIRIVARRGAARRCVDVESHNVPADISVTGELFKRTSAVRERAEGGRKATWKHVSRRVACLSRLITRNAPTGRFVVTHRETRYWNFTSSARELLRSCVVRAISRFNLRADIILLVLFRWEVFLREVEVEMRKG